MTENSNLPQKVVQYEQFLNDTLRGDLKRVLDERDKIYSQLADYLQVKNAIEHIQECKLDERELKTKVDLGCNVYLQANVPDPSKIFVCVGFGFFVEFTLTEAVNFIDKKCAHLTSISDSLTRDAARIKAHIKLVLETLREIQGLPDDLPDTDQSDVLL